MTLRQQRGISENEIEKSSQSRFNIQWAWADSIATEVKQIYCQLTKAQERNIARIKEQIKKKTKKAKAIFKSLSKVKKPTIKQQNQLKGLTSKIIKIQSLNQQLINLKSPVGKRNEEVDFIVSANLLMVEAQ